MLIRQAALERNSASFIGTPASAMIAVNNDAQNRAHCGIARRVVICQRPLRLLAFRLWSDTVCKSG